ncbi:MAG: hypothetical protein C0605_03625 [Hyphomicrobiales bacterium]|nr:MAG: hypothetical protein C0605_03625 [Hyphomicrobiales bacterium]
MQRKNQLMTPGETNKARPLIWLRIAVHLGLLLLFAAVTSHGFFDRAALLIENHRMTTLIFYIGVWGVSLGALLIAALQPGRKLRAFWAFVIALSTAAAYGYRYVSASDLSVFDILSLWTARHETELAFSFYREAGLWALLVFAVCFVLIYSVPSSPSRGFNRLLTWFGWAPAVPVCLIAAIVMLKSGGGSQAMPAQFQPLAVSAMAGFKVATLDQQQRRAVDIEPGPSKPVSSILMLIDESVRADYLDWNPGNPYTPELAANRAHFVNFGHAVSGGNCSSYSNAILRMGPMRENIPATIRTNPTLWQYAKKAGFRTVFIDGQSGRIKDPSKMQNFMTPDETRFIDRHVTFSADVPPTRLDDKVNEIIREEMSHDRLVFIYANRTGAHFPYDKHYPADQSRFKPTFREAGSLKARINSYRNLVAWSVDRLVSHLHRDLDLNDAVVLYTSDHGQNIQTGALTHCSTRNADPREALVPMLVMTGNPTLKARFQNAAALNHNKISHFALAATAIELMGYRPGDVSRNHDPSLFMAQPDRPRAFTSGDVFGIFRKEVTWNPIDLNVNYLEPEAMTPLAMTRHDAPASVTAQ